MSIGGYRFSSFRLSTTLCMAALLILVSAAQAQIVRPFTARYGTTQRGNIYAIGNTLQTCNSSSSGCINARSGLGRNLNNNDYSMVRIDVDAVEPSSNSSSADFALPAGASVSFAGLYWGANSTSSSRTQVRLRVPGAASYTPLAASSMDTFPSDFYSCFVDVTEMVAAAGAGTYTVAGVASDTGSNTFAGWSLVIVTANPTEPPRNMVVFDGYANVSRSSSSGSISVSGFITPPAGPVRTRLAVVTQEGDLGYTGDYLRLNSTTISDACNPSTNFFNSSICRLGAGITAKNPDYINQLGYDVDTFDITDILSNSATSATISLETSSDQYLPQAVVFATEVFEPVLQPSLVKTAVDVNGGDLLPGDIIEYAVPVANSGSDAAIDIVVTDAIPDHTTYVPGSLQIVSGAGAGAKTDIAGDDQAEYDPVDDRVVFRIGTGANATSGGRLAPGESSAVRFRVVIDAGTPNGTVITNQATSEFVGEVVGTSYVRLSTEASLELNVPDLTFSKGHTGDFVRGASGSYTLVASNSGHGTTAAPVTVTDTLPAGLAPTAAAGDGWSCGIAGQTVTCSRSDGLGEQLDYPAITIDVVVAQSAPVSLSNVAVVAGGGEIDATNNSATDLTTIVSSADISIAKSGPASVVAGTDVTWTVTVTNDGPSDAQGVVVADPTPAGTSFVSNSGDCAGAYPCSLGTIPAGASRTITSVFSVPAGYAGANPLSNTATLAATTDDPTTDDHSATSSVAVTTSADLEITKSGPASAAAGDDVAFTVTVTNNGPSDAANVVVCDPTPSGLVFKTSSGDCATACPCELGTIPVGESRTFTSTFLVPTDYAAPDPIVNTATASSDTADAVLTNNSDSVSVALASEADLSIAKTGTANAVPGRHVTYTITVDNLGPSDAPDTIVTDPTPAGLVFVSTSGACTGAFPCNVGKVEAGASLIITAVYEVPADYAGADPVINTASVSSDAVDPDAGNNSASASSPVVPSADLSMDKHGPIELVPGLSAEYLLTIRNAGPSDATDVVVTDAGPAGMVFVATSGDCSSAFPCSLGTIPAGQERIIAVEYACPYDYSGPTWVDNTASVSGSTADPDATNDARTISTEVEFESDLEIGKTGPGAIVPGTNAVYTITVQNHGPSLAGNVTVVDTLPTGLTFVANTGDCTTAFPCVLGDLEAGEQRTITTTLSVPAGYSTPDPVVNTASVSTTSADHNEHNDAATTSTAVQTDAGLTVSKTGPEELIPGTNNIYRISVTNTGPSDATLVEVADPTPAGLSFVSNAGDCSTAFPCALGTIAVGETRTIVSTYWMDADYNSVDPLENTATVTSPDAATVSSTTSTIAHPHADLSVNKTDAGDIVAGTDATWTITVTNDGPSVATGVIVDDPTPAGLTFVANSGDCTTGFPCTFATMAVGERREIHATFHVASDYAGANPMANTVTATRDAEDPHSADDSHTAWSNVLHEADVDILKNGPASAIPGEDVVYTITVENEGPSEAANVVVTDPTPTNLVFVANTGDCTTAFPCSYATLPAGETRTITATYHVPSDYTGPDPIVNTATVTTDTTAPDWDLDADHNWATVQTSPITPHADIELVKSGPATIVPGTTAVYTIEVTNNGPSDATSVEVADLTPTGLVFVSNAGDCTTAFPCDLGGVTAGTTKTITATYSVPAGYAGPDPVANTAIAISDTVEHNQGNEIDDATAPVAREADLSLTKTVGSAAVPGQNLVYTITVTNDDPSDATDVVVSDATPAGLLFVANTGDCTTAFPCSLGTVEAGGARTVTATYSVPSGYAGADPVANTATVTTSATDPDADNDSATANAAVAAGADLSVVKEAPTAIVPGTQAVYVLTVTNDGPSDATLVVLDDPTPAGLSFASNTGDCTSTFPCSLGTVPAGATRTVTATYDVPADYLAPDPVENSASVSSATADPNAANDSTSTSTPVTPRAGLRIVKSGPDTVVPGTDIVYTLEITSEGPSDAVNVVVDDPAPAGLVFVSNAGDCTSAFPCDLGTVSQGDTYTITSTFHVPSGYSGADPIVNEATVDSDTFDPVEETNSSLVYTTPTPSADLTIAKTDAVDPVEAGTQQVYTITVTNDGPSDAADVTVADLLDAATTYVGDTAPAGCTLTPPSSLSCAIGALVAGANVSFEVTVDVATDAPLAGTVTDGACTGSEDLCNRATVAGSVPDPDGANDSAEQPSDVVPLATSADLTLTKLEVYGPVEAGAHQTYMLSVTNAGPATATNVTLVDTLGPYMHYVLDTGPCVETPVGTLTCSLGDLAPGASDTFDVVVWIDPAAATAGTDSGSGCPGTEDTCNRATVSADQTDQSPDDNDVEIATDVVPTASAAALSVIKLDTTLEPVEPGATIDYEITVSNTGASDAANLVLYDILDPSLTWASDDAGCLVGPVRAEGTTVQCALGTLAAGTATTVRLVATVAMDAPIVGTLQDGDCPGIEDVCNRAVAVSTTAEADVADNADAEPANVSPNLLCGNGVLDPGEECEPPTAEVCNNGLDDNGNVDIDCADALCAEPGFASCDANCMEAAPCVPILNDPARIRAGDSEARSGPRRGSLSIHGRFIPTTDADPRTEGLRFLLTNAHGDIYRANLLPGDMKAKESHEKARWNFKDKQAKRGVSLRDGLYKVSVRRKLVYGFVNYSFRIQAYGDMSRALLPRMTTQVYIGDDVGYLTADWSGEEGNWKLTASDH